jgi:L-ribulose-5-phosphate 3-epimerase
MSDFGDQFGVNTYSYTQSMSAADCLRHLGDKGVRAVELMFYPGHVWITNDELSLREIHDVSQDKGIEILSMNSPNIDLNIAAATQEMRDLTLEILKDYVQVSGELGARGLVIGPGKANPLFPLPNEIMTGYFFKSLDVLLPLAKKAGIELYVENMSFAFLPAAHELMAVLEQYGSDDIKICYDVANAYFIGENPTTALQTVASRLALVHFSDTTQRTYRHDPIGDGDMDFSGLPRAIDAVGYTDPVVLEIICREADEGIQRSIDVLRASGFANDIVTLTGPISRAPVL